MTFLRVRRAHKGAATVPTLLLAIHALATLTGFSTAAHAATQVLVGVDRVHLAWQPPSGSPTGYVVLLSLNGGAFTSHAVVNLPSIEIIGKPNDQIMIKVAATFRNSSGAIIVGPQSAASDRVWFQPAAKFPVAGSWLLRCETCPALVRRSLADASVAYPLKAGLPAPWRVIGLGRLQTGIDEIVWHNPTTGAFAIWDAKLLAPVHNGAGSGSKFYRGVGSADLDRDGVEEFIVQRTDTGTVSVWGMTSIGFQKRVDLPVLAGATLAAARDFNGDGWIDLLWLKPADGTLDLWLLAKNPLLAGPLSSLLSQSLRLASGVASDGVVASTGDYDGDRSPDVLWRFADGRLAVTYLVGGRAMRYSALPFVTGDGTRNVIDSHNVDGTIGDEIALQESGSKLISVLNPVAGSTRTPVVHPGRDWTLIAIGP